MFYGQTEKSRNPLPPFIRGLTGHGAAFLLLFDFPLGFSFEGTGESVFRRIHCADGQLLEFAGVKPDDRAGFAGFQVERRLRELPQFHGGGTERAGPRRSFRGGVYAANDFRDESVANFAADLLDGFRAATALVAIEIEALDLPDGGQTGIAIWTSGHGSISNGRCIGFPDRYNAIPPDFCRVIFL
jgi:hypothetical protein